MIVIVIIGWSHNRPSHHRLKSWSSLSSWPEVMIVIVIIAWRHHRHSHHRLKSWSAEGMIVIVTIAQSYDRRCHDRLKSWSAFFTIAKLGKLWKAATVGFYRTNTGQTLKISRKLFWKLLENFSENFSKIFRKFWIIVIAITDWSHDRLKAWSS